MFHICPMDATKLIFSKKIFVKIQTLYVALLCPEISLIRQPTAKIIKNIQKLNNIFFLLIILITLLLLHISVNPLTTKFF